MPGSGPARDTRRYSRVLHVAHRRQVVSATPRMMNAVACLENYAPINDSSRFLSRDGELQWAMWLYLSKTQSPVRRGRNHFRSHDAIRRRRVRRWRVQCERSKQSNMVCWNSDLRWFLLWFSSWFSIMIPDIFEQANRTFTHTCRLVMQLPLTASRITTCYTVSKWHTAAARNCISCRSWRHLVTLCNKCIAWVI